jgi:hypothetical protein
MSPRASQRKIRSIPRTAHHRGYECGKADLEGAQVFVWLSASKISILQGEMQQSRMQPGSRVMSNSPQAKASWIGKLATLDGIWGPLRLLGN